MNGPSLYYVSIFLDLFWPTQLDIKTVLNVSKNWPFPKPTQYFCERNLGMVPQYNMCSITYPKWRVGITIEWTWMPLGLIGISWHWFFPEVVIMRIIPMGTRSGMHRGAGMHRTFPKVSDQITWGYDTMRYSGTTQDRRGCAWFTREIAGIICKKKRRKYVLKSVRNIFLCK